GNLSVTWSGWIDDVSGLNGFHWQIYLLVATNSTELDYDYTALDEGHYDAHSVGCNVSLPNAGVYCVFLTVDDVAGSYCIARRFLTFDNENVVTIHNKESPIVVESAITNPSNNDIWQTDLQDKHHNGKQVHIVWNDHFRNTHHDVNSFLGSIAAHVPDIPEPYEEKTGQPPTIRSREAIPGVNGIVTTETVYALDHQGGESIIEPPDLWSDVPNFPIEEQYFDIERVDGDSVRVWIQSYDIIGNSAVDEVLIHVDSSPPNIFDLGLTKDGVHQLPVHDSIDLYDMNVTFRTYDQHSGLFDIKWELRDMADISKTIASGTVAVQKQDGTCESKSCICIPKGECYGTDYAILMDKNDFNNTSGTHDYDYVITINVRNNAFLMTTHHFQITIDTSPPTAGTVHEGHGNNDIDYQHDFNINAWWNGFFDKESGVMTYMYVFADMCADDKTTLPTKYEYVNITATRASWTAPGPGKYYCTVIAYNHALDPSLPVCSDGIVIDVTKPIIEEISITNFRIHGGLIQDSNGTIWMVNDHGYRYHINESVEDC
ncbi:uncharacterized protein LOC102802265, partial [Saccoglossus kowalevskii]|uniref:Uncharacterized protein LOC102802265 n=1 Tax=Saccoglossus kowalevskii TaxID=10224 RepID=A0ABM0M5T4_SACKO